MAALRSQPRSGRSHALIHVTMGNGATKSRDVAFVFSIVRRTLRQGDVICRDQNRVFIHLPDTDEVGAQRVRDRLENAFKPYDFDRVGVSIRVFEPSM